MSQRKGEEGKKIIQWVCQLAFPFEKVIHLTAPKMSWENKGFRRQDALQRDLEGLSDTLCVYLWLFELLRTRRPNGFVRVLDKCLSKTWVHDSQVQLHGSMLICLICWYWEMLQREISGIGIWDTVWYVAVVRVSWSIKTPRVPQANHF